MSAIKTSDCMRHEALAVAALRRLGREPAAASPTVRLLAGGLSGSSVYLLDLAGEDVVLKVTLPSEERPVMERAWREARFYQDVATRIPVAVPHVLGIDLDESEGVAILFTAYTPPPPPDHWSEHAYTQVARQLGRLHAAFWDKTAALALPDWLRSKAPVTLAECRDAAKLWRALGERDDLHDAAVPSRRTLERLVMGIPALDLRMIAVPATLCHGDCHAGNLLQDPAGDWVWTDWQEVRLGPGVDDLAFFWQRAFVVTDTSPPYEAMVQAYGVELASVGGMRIIRGQLARALAWAELRSWLVDWLGYLGALSASRMDRVLRRIDTLIDELEVAGRL